MTRIPRFWRRFRQMMTFQDLMKGRKVMIVDKLTHRGFRVQAAKKKPLDKPCAEAYA